MGYRQFRQEAVDAGESEATLGEWRRYVQYRTWAAGVHRLGVHIGCWQRIGLGTERRCTWCGHRRVL